MNAPATKTCPPARPFVLPTKVLSCLICIILLCSISYARAESRAGGTAEYAVKAAYIYNILRFVSWDESSPLAQSETLNICLYKSDPFKHHLKPISKKSINDKQIKLKTIFGVSQTSFCHLLFVSDSDDVEVAKLKHQIKHRDTILLGNDIRFVKQGGLFSFYIENNKVRLGAHRAAIADSELNISSLLLEVSRLHGEQQ